MSGIEMVGVNLERPGQTQILYKLSGVLVRYGYEKIIPLKTNTPRWKSYAVIHKNDEKKYNYLKLSIHTAEETYTIDIEVHKKFMLNPVKHQQSYSMASIEKINLFNDTFVNNFENIIANLDISIQLNDTIFDETFEIQNIVSDNFNEFFKDEAIHLGTERLDSYPLLLDVDGSSYELLHGRLVRYVLARRNEADCQVHISIYVTAGQLILCVGRSQITVIGEYIFLLRGADRFRKLEKILPMIARIRSLIGFSQREILDKRIEEIATSINFIDIENTLKTATFAHTSIMITTRLFIEKEYSDIVNDIRRIGDKG